MLLNDYLDLFHPIQALNQGEKDDVVAWFPTLERVFPLKMAHRIWIDNKALVGSRLCKNIWNLKAPQRIKALLWLVINEVLLTNQARCRRGLASNDVCVLYGVASKTVLHAL